MDYEYQNGTGPMDARSPFAQVSLNAQRFPATPGGSKKSVFSRIREDVNGRGADSAGKGNFGAFDSPTRQAGPGASRNASPNKALPPVPAAWNGLFSTPRKNSNAMDIDDSSAGETPKSPERQDDSEAGTPAEMMAQQRRKMVEMDTRSAPVLPTLNSLAVSPSKERTMDWERSRDRPPSSSRKESFFGKIKNKFNSPGRGEIPRGDIVQSKERRIRKSKSRDAQKQLARQRRYSISDSGSDAENDDSELPPPRTLSPRKRSGNHAPPLDGQDNQAPHSNQKEPHWISSLFTFIGQHPTVPHILSFYAQFAFNLSLLLIFLYTIYSAWTSIRGDIDKRAFEASADILAEMAQCTKHFTLNSCDSPTRAPALETVCNNWAKCMNQDATKIARAKVSAGTFAEIYNSFIEPISYKAMIFTALFVFGGIFVSNMAFGLVRNKATEQVQQQQWGYGPPPPTPQRHVSGADLYGQGTPWHQPVGLEPAPSAVGMIEGRGSPVRRLQYH